MSAKVTQLSNGAEGVFIKNDRFNTTLVSYNFYMPLRAQTAAHYALLPFVLTTCSEKYPDFSRLNYKLSKLYGANLSASAEKVGDFQLIKIAISVIDDRFTLDNEQLFESAAELLNQLVFEPKISNGAFCEADVTREKRKATEHIKGEISEKRIYARKRLIEEMYHGEPYGVAKCGTIEDVEKITGASLNKAWQDVLSHAFIRVNVISRNMPQRLFDAVSERLSKIDRQTITGTPVCTPTAKAKKVTAVAENLDIAQGKLVMGFSSEIYGDEESTAGLAVMCDIFGGGPYSRLFNNVREKMSLCYYCSASSVRAKGLILVDSGVEKKNAETAEAEILNQLKIIKNGEFTDTEFDSSIKGMTDSLKSYNDSQELLDVWYSVKIFKEKLLSPEDSAKLISSVTRDDVIRAARGVNLHTVYKLLPKECEQ